MPIAAMEKSDRHPGLAARGILHRIEDGDQMVENETARFDQQPHQERIAAVDLEEAVDIRLAGVRQPRMGDDVFKCQARRASRETLDLSFVQRKPTPKCPCPQQ
jgi:hypothetical protein